MPRGPEANPGQGSEKFTSKGREGFKRSLRPISALLTPAYGTAGNSGNQNIESDVLKKPTKPLVPNILAVQAPERPNTEVAEPATKPGMKTARVTTAPGRAGAIDRSRPKGDEAPPREIEERERGGKKPPPKTPTADGAQEDGWFKKTRKWVFGTRPGNIALTLFTAGATFLGLEVGGVTHVTPLRDNSPAGQTALTKNSESAFNFFPTQNALKSHGFSTHPPLRTESPASASTMEIPTIAEYTESQYFIPGITFRLKEKPSTVHPDAIFPHIGLNGYLIAKEINPDGSVMLALEIPSENGLFTPDDFNKSPSSVDELTDDRNEGKISGNIVWLKLNSYTGQAVPLSFGAGWSQDFSSTNSARSTTLPNEIYGNIRIGDPVQATAYPEIGSAAEARLSQNYQGPAYAQAKVKYESIVGANAATIDAMLRNAKSGEVSLREQLINKSYVFIVSILDFVPRI